jgi:hypothetical protein
MIRTRLLAFALTLPLVLAWPSSSIASGDEDAMYRRIRMLDRGLQALFDEGLRRSATLRALAARITQSDVVVYVMCDGDPRSGIAGRMTFQSAAGGLRYLVVRLVTRRSRAQQIAILAHELQHAVEVAETPAIVDSESLAREYLRIGHVKPHAATPGIAFDTQSAIDAGRQVLHELATMTGD